MRPTNQPHDEDATVQHEVSSRQTEAWLTRPLVATRKSFVQDRNLLQLGVSAGFIHPFSAPTTSQSSLAAIFLRCTLRRKKLICVWRNTYSDKIGYFDPDGKETKTEKTK